MQKFYMFVAVGHLLTITYKEDKMYSKDKTFNVHFRISDNDYSWLINSYNDFLKNLKKPISFSEYLRRRCIFGSTKLQDADTSKTI